MPHEWIVTQHMSCSVATFHFIAITSQLLSISDDHFQIYIKEKHKREEKENAHKESLGISANAIKSGKPKTEKR